MLLTLSTTRAPATDLGFLLHKHPDRAQVFDAGIGTAQVFYPEATDERCTAALLLEVDPVGLVRGSGTALAQYVNDRPYATSSLLAVALRKVFGTAMAGRCTARPELAEQVLPLVVELPALSCRGGADEALRFFDPSLTGELVGRLAAAAEKAGLFDELDTGWLLLDAELLPWSAKAGELLRMQYAAVGAAARAALPRAVSVVESAAARGVDVGDLPARTRTRAADAEAFTAAYRRYCWPTDGLAGVRLAPFQVLAAHGTTFVDRPHAWHLALAARLAAADPDLVAPTRWRSVDTTEPESVAAAVAGWEELTAAGGEGMVVKPAAGLVQTGAGRGGRGRPQPGLKVRGREYLRTVYGPEYTEHLDQLRTRGLGRKRSLALREYALGLEALERLARGEPLWRVHECVFAVLALESEPVDPRL